MFEVLKHLEDIALYSKPTSLGILFQFTKFFALSKTYSVPNKICNCLHFSRRKKEICSRQKWLLLAVPPKKEKDLINFS